MKSAGASSDKNSSTDRATFFLGSSTISSYTRCGLRSRGRRGTAPTYHVPGDEISSDPI